MKYRIWSKYQKQYFTDCAIDTDGDLYKVNFGYEEEIILTPLNKKDFIIERSTGLFDKNGKEIYEGDIIDTSLVEFAQVVFVEGCFIATDKEIGVYIHQIQDDELEIIGNIHDKE